MMLVLLLVRCYMTSDTEPAGYARIELSGLPSVVLSWANAVESAAAI